MTNPLAPLRRGPDHVWLYGHRGARGIVPENTLESFDHALAAGLRAMEVDVCATRDGVPVVTHDLRLAPDRARGPDGGWLAPPGPRLRDLSLDDLARYDVGALRPGSDYARRFPEQHAMPGLRVPTLDAVCERLGAVTDEPVWVMLEIKSDPARPGDVPPLPDYVASVIEVVRRHGLAGTTMLHAFDWSVLAECARQAPDMPRSYLSQLAGSPGEGATVYPGSPWLDGADEALDDLPGTIAALGGSAWAPYLPDVTARDVEAAHAHDLVVNVWTVNEPDDIERMVAFGVDGICTDYPERAIDVLKGMGLRARGRQADLVLLTGD